MDKWLPKFGKDHTQAQTIALDSGKAALVQKEIPQVFDKNGGDGLALVSDRSALESMFAKFRDVDLSAETPVWENTDFSKSPGK